MPPARSSPGVLRERLFLAFGLGSAVVLALAALVGGGDPQSAGRAELVSTAARVAEAVKAEWKTLWMAGSAGEPECYAAVDPSVRIAAASPAFVEGTELERKPDQAEAVFDALLAQSEKVELVDGKLPDALELVLESLQKTEDPARKAEARLRAVQLAAGLGRSDVAREQYALACAELQGTERRGTVSYRILLALSLAGCLDEPGRRELAQELQELARAGRLAWKLPQPALQAPYSPAEKACLVEDASVSALLDLLRPLAPDFASNFENSRRAQAVMAAVGDIPYDDAICMHLRHTAVGLFGWWTNASTAQIGGFISEEAVANRLRQQLDKASILPAGFIVDLDPLDAGATPVREHDSLDGDFGFTIKHEDPEGWIRRSAARQKLLRGALLVLALLSAAAGVATFRALRRERTLATLKTDFVANVSHELRTPLASILLLSENLEAGRVSGAADQARYHGLIRREALRLRRLVDDVLDFSRLERGKRIDIRREGLRVDPWLERTFEELADWAREHAFELALVRSPTQAEAEIDAEALRRALLNLLDNARKHSGGGRIELATSREGTELVLSVRDHGRGIPLEDRERVFDPFVRLSNGDAPGAGLGLSIVREIAREHGGSVRALDPADGPGIVFQMRIPLAEESPT